MSTELEIPTKSGSVWGTLTEPQTAEPYPLVICAHGTGKLDRNEGPIHLFDAAAQSLIKENIACFRFDKRGAGKSKGDFNRTSYWQFYDDFECVFDHFAHQRPDHFSHIIALGHSEGTLLSAHLAGRRSVDGLVLLTPFIEDMETILMQQAANAKHSMDTWPGISGRLIRLVTRLAGDPRETQRKLIEQLKSTDKDFVRVGLQKFPARHLRELLTLDPPSAYAAVNIPTLLISGEKDLQCDPQAATIIAKAIGPKASAHIIDDLTHLLRLDEGPASFASYKQQLKRPVADDVLRLTAQWLSQFKTV